jgi:serine/threonine protein kinase
LQQSKILNCPNISEVYDNFKDKNYHYLVQELLEKSLLDHILSTPKKRLIEEEALSFTKQIINAITHIHKIKIYHRGYHKNK